MLIGEVVPELLKYLRVNTASQYRGSFRHVLVDEYQDLNRSEQDLLDLLAEEADYTVIGDDDQFIYSSAEKRSAYPLDERFPLIAQQRLGRAHAARFSRADFIEGFVQSSDTRVPIVNPFTIRIDIRYMAG
jgi:hypothetical protein